MAKASKRIPDLLLTTAIKGRASEDRVEEALQWLATRNEIHHFLRTEKGDICDRNGIDFWVFPETRNWALPLQVKSSIIGKEKHEVEQGSKIPCIVVDGPYDRETLGLRILHELGLSTENIIASLSTEPEEEIHPDQVTL